MDAVRAVALWPGLFNVERNYVWVEQMAPIAVAYSAVFTLYTLYRIAFKLFYRIPRMRDSAFLSEVNAAPITAMLTYMFVVSVVNCDLTQLLLYAWWGCGFYISVAVIVLAARRGKTVNWIPVRVPISWACKLCYVALMIVFYRRAMPVTMFTFSVWIIGDQVGRLFMYYDADRTRRTFDDAWLFRLCYPLGLFLPLVSQAHVPYRPAMAGFGLVLMVLWLVGLVDVARRGELMKLPPEAKTLRNMLYYDELDTLEVQEPKLA